MVAFVCLWRVSILTLLVAFTLGLVSLSSQLLGSALLQGSNSVLKFPRLHLDDVIGEFSPVSGLVFCKYLLISVCKLLSFEIKVLSFQVYGFLLDCFIVGGFNLRMFMHLGEDLVFILVYVSAGAGCVAPLVLINGNSVLVVCGRSSIGRV